MYYRRRISNKVLSGDFAYLNRKRITWLESYDSQTWHKRTGRIVVVGKDAKRFYVDPESVEGLCSGCHWIEEDPMRCKDIKVQQ